VAYPKVEASILTWNQRTKEALGVSPDRHKIFQRVHEYLGREREQIHRPTNDIVDGGILPANSGFKVLAKGIPEI
jgi:hypothetical protein